MKNLQWKYLFSASIFLLTLQPPQTAALIEDVLDVLRLTKEIVSSIAGTWQFVEQTPLKNEIDLPFMKRKEQKILLKMTEVSRQIELTETYLTNAAAWTIDSINAFMRSNTKLELMLHELADLCNRIAAQARMLRSYTDHQDEVERVTLETAAQWIVSPNIGAVQGLLNRIHLLVTGTNDLKYFGKTSILQLLNEELQVGLKTTHKILTFVSELVHRCTKQRKGKPSIL